MIRVGARVGWLIVWSAAVVDAAPEGARILRVEHRVREHERATESFWSARLPKFRPGAGSTATERFYVHWEPGPNAPAEGLVLTFEFVQARSPRIRTLFIQYPFRVQGRRRAVFEIAPEVSAVGGAVRAWRVRVVRRGRLLAERTSESWSAW